jgi:glycosyltransferase involved in cell wall biosynthesis
LVPDILHLHSSKAGVLGRIAARSVGLARRTFYSPRGLSFLQEDHSPLARTFYEKVEWAAARLGGTLVACSESEKELLRTHLRSRRIALVENGIDVDIVPAHSDRGDSRVQIGIAGRITAARNPSLFARLARSAAAPDVDFTWIGGGEPADRLMLEQAGIRVTGWLPRATALAETSRLDLYLHPSLWEGMPVALIEAQVCGLPAVVTDVVGNRDVVLHGETGLIGSNPEELSAHLAQLVGDAPLRRKLGARAREIAMKRFDLRRVVDDYERLYMGA